MSAALNSKTICDLEMKFSWIVKIHKLINLVQFKWYMTSSLHNNDVAIVKKLFSYKIRKVERFLI